MFRHNKLIPKVFVKTGHKNKCYKTRAALGHFQIVTVALKEKKLLETPEDQL